MTKKKWSNFSNFVPKVITKKVTKSKKKNKISEKNINETWTQFVEIRLFKAVCDSPSLFSKQTNYPKTKAYKRQSTLRLWLLKVNPIDFIKYFCCSYMILAIDLQCVCLILYNRKTLSLLSSSSSSPPFWQIRKFTINLVRKSNPFSRQKQIPPPLLVRARHTILG